MQGNAAWGDFHSIRETMPSSLQIILPDTYPKELHILQGADQARNIKLQKKDQAKKEADQDWYKARLCSIDIKFYENRDFNIVLKSHSVIVPFPC